MPPGSRLDVSGGADRTLAPRLGAAGFGCQGSRPANAGSTAQLVLVAAAGRNLCHVAVLLGVILVAIIAATAYAAATGKLKRAGCCCPADPRQDLRMRAAFEEPAASDAPTHQS